MEGGKCTMNNIDVSRQLFDHIFSDMTDAMCELPWGMSSSTNLPISPALLERCYNWSPLFLKSFENGLNLSGRSAYMQNRNKLFCLVNLVCFSKSFHSRGFRVLKYLELMLRNVGVIKWRRWSGVALNWLTTTSGSTDRNRMSRTLAKDFKLDAVPRVPWYRLVETEERASERERKHWGWVWEWPY